MSERKGTKGLELWCKKMTEGYPGVKIDNMTTSWRDGLAFCAIIHHFRPDLIDFSKLSKDDVYHNNELAFRVAEHHLGIPALLEPEDMVEYDVPDRLSILTYLSQFYQAFAASQGASKRIPSKRPQSPPDHDIGSPTSSSPPTKVAFVSVGKIRRDPCAKCRLPVFLAERLNIGKLLFHRTCFRCARCNSQLTLASYYETENEEFCCEVCPDEESLTAKKSHEKVLLQKSMSDEEKSANLRLITGQTDGYSELFETALEEVAGNGKSSNDFSEARSSFFLSQIGRETSEQGDDKPPLLPKTDPPELKQIDRPSKDYLVDSAGNDSGFPNTRLSELYSSKVSLEKNSNSKMELSHDIVTKDKPTEEEGNISLVKARARLFESNINDIRKSDVHRNSKDNNKVPRTPVKSTIPIIKLDEIENFDDNFSKTTYDNETDDRKINTITPKITVTDNVTNNVDVKRSLVTRKSETDEEPAAVISHDIENVEIEYTKYDSGVGTQEPKTIKNSEQEQYPITEVIDLENSPPFDKSDTKRVEKSPLVRQDESPGKEDADLTNTSPGNAVIDLTTMSSSKESVDITNTSLDDSSRESSPEKSHSATSREFPAIRPGKEDADLTNTSPGNAVIDLTTMSSSKESVDITNTSLDDSSRESSPEKLHSAATRELPAIRISKSSEDKGDPNTDVILIEDSPEKSESGSGKLKGVEYPDDLNPFDEDDVQEEELKSQNTSLNPFGSDEDDEELDQVSLGPLIKPTPTPRMKKKVLPNWSDTIFQGTPVRIERVSINPFESDEEEEQPGYGVPPVPAARKKKIATAPNVSLNPFWSEDEGNQEFIVKQPVPKPRTSIDSTPEYSSLNLTPRHTFGSSSSISSGSAPGSARKKKPAPRPPIPSFKDPYGPSSLNFSPSHSAAQSPKLTPKYRKNRMAPPPPPPQTSTPIDQHKKQLSSESLSSLNTDSGAKSMEKSDSLYCTPELDIETEKIVKDEENRNRQSQSQDNYLQSPTSSESSSNVPAPNKSTYGQWKRRKGQAPKRPIPQRRLIKVLPMSEIRRELDLIEVQQQGLEKQGVKIEQIIREKCEGKPDSDVDSPDDGTPIEVEDLILQLFEIVNEKNELFRKQTELMYLKRQQRLEEEHADVEYQIRCLMLKPEENKTDSDKAREEELIKRLVEIVERRNEIIECLENDRVRETEEDNCINNHISLYTLKREGDKSELDKSSKEKKKSKKEKEKHHKKEKSKNKDKIRADSDKDVDESESNVVKEKKKKKKFNLF